MKLKPIKMQKETQEKASVKIQKTHKNALIKSIIKTKMTY